MRPSAWLPAMTSSLLRRSTEKHNWLRTAYKFLMLTRLYARAACLHLPHMCLVTLCTCSVSTCATFRRAYACLSFLVLISITIVIKHHDPVTCLLLTVVWLCPSNMLAVNLAEHKLEWISSSYMSEISNQAIIHEFLLLYTATRPATDVHARCVTQGFP